MPKPRRAPMVDRRRVLKLLTASGAAGMTLGDALVALAGEQGALSKETIAQAERLAGLEFTDAEREMMTAGLDEMRAHYAAIRAVPLPNSVAPAVRFMPSPPLPRHVEAPPPRLARLSVTRPHSDEDLAFATVAELAELLRTGAVTSLELTRLYLDRLRRFDPLLHCVVTLTEDRALGRAARADRELAAGRWRGPLHGVPWGAKDLLSVKGYPTTWGAEPYCAQFFDEDATVVRRLDEAGAILVAKLALGALARGDVWFGGTTRNPWKPDQGSSGSSAGAAAAVAAGLVGFAIGTETRGSIVSPCARCGCSGLRPTFGRVSRDGVMALAWSMDKVGPIARSAADCALVFAATHGPHGSSEPVADAPFAWDPGLDVRGLRVGVVRSAFEGDVPADRREQRDNDLATLETLRALGLELIPVTLPDLPIDALSFILDVESAAAFDELTRSDQDDLLARQDPNAWPNTFRTARLVPAVEYLQANRVRTLLQREMDRLFERLDAFVAPSFGNPVLRLTNLTGHPAVVVPNGFRADGTPTSITFTGQLWAEAELLALAHAYQAATAFNRQRPALGS